MSPDLKATLTRLVQQSKTSDRAADHLHEVLRQTTDRRDRQQVELAIRHAERNAAAL